MPSPKRTLLHYHSPYPYPTNISSSCSLNPFTSSTVSKWSDKVSAASAVQLKSANKFRAVNQNTWAQIEATMQADGERLIERTRKLKAGYILRVSRHFFFF
jgi:BRCT domain type II-containing protein